jgi:beta-galactosidase
MPRKKAPAVRDDAPQALPQRYPPVSPKCPHFLHGGDYNPDQWLRTPEVWDEDMRMMRLAGCNVASVGIFSWTQLEPAEGRYTFGWLDTIMDKLAAAGAWAVLATPSAAQPAWMSRKYPDILRMGADRVRRRHGNRVNFCLTSPAYRAKCREIARRLAERYRDHPALLVWHMSNEYGGDCHCPLCQGAFREWLKAKYGSLDALNDAWWTGFWSHTFTDWEQIESPGPRGEGSMMGLILDWNRFVTDQTVSFMVNEAAPLRELTPDVPITTNMMGTYGGLNYRRFIPHLDVMSWDNYPFYHDRPEDWKLAARVSFVHDMYRAFKSGKPFMLMESTPSAANWWPVMKLKRPGLHQLTSLQAVAHGADTVMYFQWRAGRGGAEKFHGAVVTHNGDEHTRVFGEVAELGVLLKRLDPVIGTTVRPQVAVVWDWENDWAIGAAQGPRHEKRHYTETCQDHYRPFWQAGVPVDVIGMDDDFSGYRLLVAPMLYMVRPGVAERIESFVARGGTFVTTYWSGIVDENDRCFTGGFPGPLRKVLGIRSEELDALYDDEANRVVPCRKGRAGLSGRYEARLFCDLIHAEGAEVLARYGDDFYAGRPVLTVNRFDEGRAFYVASRNDDRFHRDFSGWLMTDLKLPRVIPSRLPEGVTAQTRTDGRRTFVFLLNFKRKAQKVGLASGRFSDLATGKRVGRSLTLAPYGSVVLERR